MNGQHEDATTAAGSDVAEPARHGIAPGFDGWVTVLMPVFNGERYVAGAIESILAQTHAQFEFLIIDDGSTDSTPALLAAYAARDPRVRVVTQPNGDQPAALNHGLRLARHDWVAIIDHDDVSLPQRLERQLGVLAAHPDARVIGGWAIEISASGAEIGLLDVGPTSVTAYQDLMTTNGWVSLVHPSVLLHRPTILALGGYDPAFGAAADTELWSRVAGHHLVLAVPEPLVRYRVHSGSMSVRRYFEQQRALRWIRARQTARRQDAPVPDIATLRAAETSWRPAQLRQIRRDWRSYFERRHRLARVEGHPLRSGFYMLAAYAIMPRWAIKRLIGKI